MTTTNGALVMATRSVLCARWERDLNGALVCRWKAEPAVAPLAPAESFKLTGRPRLPSRGAALRALTAALDDPPTAA